MPRIPLVLRAVDTNFEGEGVFWFGVGLYHGSINTILVQVHLIADGKLHGVKVLIVPIAVAINDKELLRLTSQ